MYLAEFFSGMFVFNSIPHLVKGITGETHMTPFKRVSSAIVNVLWAFANLFTGLALSGFTVYESTSLVIFLTGGLVMALANAWLFSKPNARFPWHKD